MARGACSEITCPATSALQATFPLTVSGTLNVAGTCVAGYAGTVTANCSLTGSWTFGASCART